MLQVHVSLTGDVIHNIPNVLLPAAADEILLRSAVLERHTITKNGDVCALSSQLFFQFNNKNYLCSSAVSILAPLPTRAESSL